jgi:hypothetical protein
MISIIYEDKASLLYYFSKFSPTVTCARPFPPMRPIRIKRERIWRQRKMRRYVEPSNGLALF